MLEISLKAEKIGQIGWFLITNTWVASTFVVFFLIFVTWRIVRTNYDLKSRFYNFIEMLVEGFAGIIESVVGRGKVSRMVFPIIVTFFVFIMLNNWFGIAPGVGSIGFWEPKHHEAASTEHVVESETPSAATLEKTTGTTEGEHPEEGVTIHPEESIPTVSTESEVTDHGEENKNVEHAEEEMIFVPLFRSANSDLNMTLAIAIFSVIFIQVVGVRTLGLKSYLRKFFNFSSPILLFVGLLEIISEIVKIFSFSFRLFGNIFAGDVLLIVIAGLVPYVAPIPFLGIEMFAGLVQALIFAMLTLVFIKTSVSHGEH